MQHSIIKKELVRLGEPAASGDNALARPAAARPGRHKKAVKLVRVGQRVAALELTCSCGEVSVVEFDYPEDNQTKAAS